MARDEILSRVTVTFEVSPDTLPFAPEIALRDLDILHQTLGDNALSVQIEGEHPKLDPRTVARLGTSIQRHGLTGKLTDSFRDNTGVLNVRHALTVGSQCMIATPKSGPLVVARFAEVVASEYSPLRLLRFASAAYAAHFCEDLTQVTWGVVASGITPGPFVSLQDIMDGGKEIAERFPGRNLSHLQENADLYAYRFYRAKSSLKSPE
ncbi:MAG TPA: hypothetical protein VFB59_05220 [Candidatus Saccharimonadales bacterium]|nr:hypothetical protein [Candidatus Saccharimonadales bacterium]